MIPVKVQCGCGQRYLFDVEPVDGRMPVSVACPTCGADGTEAANEIIARTLAPKPPPLPTISAGGIRLRKSSPIAEPATLPAAGPASVPPALRKKRAKESGDSSDEQSGLNKLGSWVITGSGTLAAMSAGGVLPVILPTNMLWPVVAVCGFVGGMMNIAGRGPIWTGMLYGPATGVGGFLVAYLWIRNRESVYWWQLTLAYIIGAMPGVLLQWLLMKFFCKKPSAG